MLQAHCKWEISDEFSYGRAMLGHRKGPTMKPSPKSGPVADSKNAPAGIPELIAALASSSPVARKKAREGLVALGRPAVPALIQLLSHRQPHVRWEAAKALGAVADPIAAFRAGQCFERSRRRRPMAGSRGIGRFGPRCPATIAGGIDGTE